MAVRSKAVKFYNEEKIAKINKETLKLWDRYEMDMTIRELSPNTMAAYRSDAMQWFIYIYENQGNVSVKELEESDIEEFLYYCKKNGNNSRRMKRRMSTISAFYIFLRKKRIINENPMEFIDRPKKDMDVITQTYLSKAQIHEMNVKLRKKIRHAKSAAQKEYLMTIQLYAMMSLSTMARVNAVRNIRWDSINMSERMIYGALEKEQRVVDLMFSRDVQGLLEALKEFREVNNIKDGGYLFPSVYKGEIRPVTSNTADVWCKKIGALIGAPTLHPHDFRHSGATLLKNAGMSLEDISSLLNHMGTDVTRKFYIKQDNDRLRANKDLYEI